MAALICSFSYAAEPVRMLNSMRPTENTPAELLRRAAFEGDLGSIEQLLAQGVNVNAKDRDGWTALIWAQLGNRTGAVELLLTRGAAIDAKDESGHTAAHQAAMAGRLEVLESLLHYGASVNTVARSGLTPLMDAATYGRVRVMELLLAKGADPNAVNEDGRTALSLAHQHGRRNVTFLLLANGADPNFQAKRLQAGLSVNGTKPKGPTRVRLAGCLRDTDVIGAQNRPSGCRLNDPLDPRASQTVYTVAPPRIESRNAALREAFQTWEQLENKYPDMPQRLRHASGKRLPLEDLCAKEPLLRRALELWQTIRAEHPNLASSLMDLARMGR